MNLSCRALLKPGLTYRRHDHTLLLLHTEGVLERREGRVHMGISHQRMSTETDGVTGIVTNGYSYRERERSRITACSCFGLLGALHLPCWLAATLHCKGPHPIVRAGWRCLTHLRISSSSWLVELGPASYPSTPGEGGRIDGILKTVLNLL